MSDGEDRTAEVERLRQALTEALERQTATSEVLRAISGAPADVQPVFDAIADSAARLCAADLAGVFRVADGQVHEVSSWSRLAPEFQAMLRRTFPRPLDASTYVGRAILERRIVHVADMADPAAPQSATATQRFGFRGQLTVPMLRGGDPIGGITVVRRQPGLFSDDQIRQLAIFADQAVIAIENARLFRELEGKNRELELASRHKSEFLANMSHELRTPLNAIIGFSEVLTERMFGDLNEKQDEYLRDIHASGQHLLSLINDILDLSKVEAGRMDLELADVDLPSAIDNALTLVRERAGRRGVALAHRIDGRVGVVRADERKVKQVVLNLLSNAIKFTPEGGRIDVRATVDADRVEVSVTDTGVGIAPEDQAAVFEEFRQVGPADGKVEGTGLGLTLSRKFVELHGGRIQVESQVGQGSTFTFTLPVQGPGRSSSDRGSESAH